MNLDDLFVLLSCCTAADVHKSLHNLRELGLLYQDRAGSFVLTREGRDIVNEVEAVL